MRHPSPPPPAPRLLALPPSTTGPRPPRLLPLSVPRRRAAPLFFDLPPAGPTAERCPPCSPPGLRGGGERVPHLPPDARGAGQRVPHFPPDSRGARQRVAHFPSDSRGAR